MIHGPAGPRPVRSIGLIGALALLLLATPSATRAQFSDPCGLDCGVVLAASAYAEPMLGTVLLIAAGFGELSWTIAIAGVLILGGAAVASQEMYRRRQV